MTSPLSIFANDRYAAYNRADLTRYPKYLTDAQKLRLERIRIGQMLYESPEQFFLGEGRAQFAPPRIKKDGEEAVYYNPLNLLKVVSETSAELLFGGDAILKVDNGAQEEAVRAIAKRSHLDASLAEIEIEASRSGEAYLEALRIGGEAYVVARPPQHLHPEGQLGPDRQYASYVYYEEATVDGSAAKVNYLLEVRYLPGSIERKLYRLQSDSSRGEEVDLRLWPAYAAPDAVVPPASEKTGVAMNTIIWIPNLMIGDRVYSDYDGLIGPQDRVNQKVSQHDVVVEKHGRPKLAAPKESAGKDGNLGAAKDVYFVRAMAEAPKYIGLPADLAAAMLDLDKAIEQFSLLSGYSPEMLGLRKDGGAESAKALRIRMTKPLGRAARKAKLRQPLIVRALEIAQALTLATPGVRFDVGEVSYVLQDGLPVDRSEQASTLSMLRSAKLISRRRAIEEQLLTRDAVNEELAELDREADADAITLSLGGEAQTTNEQNPSGDAQASDGLNQLRADAGGDAGQESEE
jgi:hypothetical protein